MKRYFLLAISIVLCLGLLGCSGGGAQGAPESVSEEAYNTGREAVAIAESFLNGDISADDAYTKVDSLQNILDLDPDTYPDDSSVRSYFVALESYLLIASLGGDTDTEAIQDCLNRLKELLNLE